MTFSENYEHKVKLLAPDAQIRYSDWGKTFYVIADPSHDDWDDALGAGKTSEQAWKDTDDLFYKFRFGRLHIFSMMKYARLVPKLCDDERTQ